MWKLGMHIQIVWCTGVISVDKNLGRYSEEASSVTTGKSDITVCQMNTANRPRNTAKALPCVNTRQNLHGIVPYGKEHFAVLFQHAHGKDLCRVFFVLHGSEK
jgi:hypothetical protein